MSRVKLKRNKTYTSIILQEVSELAFSESVDLRKSINGLSVIKPSKKAWAEFVKLHSLTLDKVKEGEEYKVLGTTFKVVRNLDYSRKGVNEWYPILRYYDRSMKTYEEIGILSTDNFAVAVHELCFKNHTGTLLYF